MTLTLLGLSLLPVIVVVGEQWRLKASRWMMKKYWYRTHDNNQSDHIKFLELNAGPEHNMQLKTAPLNAVLFITVTLGAAFPLFYLLAVFAIAV